MGFDESGKVRGKTHMLDSQSNPQTDSFSCSHETNAIKIGNGLTIFSWLSHQFPNIKTKSQAALQSYNCKTAKRNRFQEV